MFIAFREFYYDGCDVIGVFSDLESAIKRAKSCRSFDEVRVEEWQEGDFEGVVAWSDKRA